MDAFAGESRVFPYGFCPQDWLPCAGQQLPIMQYQLLYAVIGTTYGGDGQTVFNLPNLQGQIVIGTGTGAGLTPRPLNSHGGAAAVTCTTANFPQHDHTINVVAALGTSPNPDGNLISNDQGNRKYLRPAPSPISFSNVMPAIGPAGTTTPSPHDNMQPYLPLQHCICVYGNYPPRP
jgi:microcystin-dependent protein